MKTVKSCSRDQDRGSVLGSWSPSMNLTKLVIRKPQFPYGTLLTSTLYPTAYVNYYGRFFNSTSFWKVFLHGDWYICCRTC